MSIDISAPGVNAAALRAIYMDIPIESEAGTAYSLVAADAYKYKRFTAAGAVIVTIPPNIFTVNQRVRMSAVGAGGVTLLAGAGVTLNSRGAALTSAGQYAVFEVVCVATNVFDVIGDMV